MTTSALLMMIVAMVIIWGGLLASIGYAVKASRAARVRDPKQSGSD